MELTVLGAAGTWPGPGDVNCGYLVSHEGTHIWLDAGTGTFAELQRYIAVDEIAALVVSHGHPDHFVDVIPAFYARHYGGLGPPGLPFYSPEGFTDLMSLLVSEAGRDVMSQAFAFNVVKDGDRFDVGPLSILVREMAHVGGPAMGFRIEAGGASLAYTGDSGPCDAVVEMARGVDVFLAEATYQESSSMYPFHMSAVQAAEASREAGVGRLILTHLTPPLDPAISRDEAMAVYEGPVDVAVRGMVVEVGA